MASPLFFLRLTAVIVAWLFAGGRGLADGDCASVVGVMASSEGRVELQRQNSDRWQPAAIGMPLCEGDSVRAGELSRAALQLINDAVLRIDQNTTVQLISLSAKAEDRSLLNLISGAVQSFSRKPRKLAINTPYINGLIEGTEFVARIDATRGVITVIEGTVIAENSQGSVVVPAGSAATATLSEPPSAVVVVNPRDAAQWSLYYPPLLAILDGAPSALPAGTPSSVQEALRRAAANDSANALALLERVPASDRDAAFYFYRAALLVDVGQVEAARQAIEAALALDPAYGPAYALRAVIAVVQNDREQALRDGREAVRLSPQSSAASIALSYAEQASFDLAAARATLEATVATEPANALAWARLAEVRLMLGDRSGSREAAATAVRLEPNLARTQRVEGFAALALFQNTRAIEAFRRAIALSPADPMAHLGLGLAKISEGNLVEGRKDLEVAVALDSGNSLLRSYLGKAYFEEQRAPLDEEQFDIAKQLDPHDPTPFLYSAITKQAENRPVEALHDMQASIALNDNRAPFRGRLLLDEDRAVRQADLGQIYSGLGFRELGMVEASKALAVDPANASAHRLLSNLSSGDTRREISRISNLFQAQMLQDVNLVPVQPSLSLANPKTITGITGPGTPGFNEFTPLFEQNQVQFNAQAFAGNEKTYGGEAVVTGLYNQVSVSGGGFGYWTDGFRPNYDIKEKSGNFFLQTAITPQLNVQMEAIVQRLDQGFIEFNFDKNNYSPDYQRHLDQDMLRVGARFSPNNQSDIIVSYIYNKRDERIDDQFRDPFFDLLTKDKVDDQASVGEAQVIHRGERYNVVAGAAYGYVDRDEDSRFSFTFPGVGTFTDNSSTFSTINDPRGYLYGNIVFPETVTWTVGGAYQHYEESRGNDLTVSGFLPKLGVQWNVTEDFLLRGAVFKAIKPVITNSRLLEPTQVAGFDQYFDDSNGSEYWRYGAGFDWRATRDLSFGGEITWREIDQPLENLETREWITSKRREQNHRVFAYWTPFKELALGAQLVYDSFKATDRDVFTDFGTIPERVKTYSMPLTAKYFSPHGFFVGVGGTFVHQDVRRADTAQFPYDAEGNDSFFLVDTSIGYTFPKRLGFISFEVRNLFDTSFHYQDDSYREFTNAPTVSRFFPDRTFIGRVVLNY